MRVRIREGYLGQCVADAMRCKNDATHEEFHKFDKPLDTGVSNKMLENAGLPPMPSVEGVWEGICDEHCDPERKHRS
jgi:hypothetical protein